MNTNAKTHHISNEYQPTVTVGLIGMVFPLQNEPEHDGSERRGIGIDLTFNSRDPKGVGEGVDQSAHQTTGLDGNEFGGSQLIPVLENKLTRKMRNCPEKKQDGGG